MHHVLTDKGKEMLPILDGITKCVVSSTTLRLINLSEASSEQEQVKYNRLDYDISLVSIFLVLLTGD